MLIHELETPAILLDLDVLEKNLRAYAKAAEAEGKELWPMLKTHKSTEIMRMQFANGSRGVLAGTLDEAEAAVEAGAEHVMYAYPVAGNNVARVIRLAKRGHLILRLDDVNTARTVSEAAVEAGIVLDYTAIVDCGLHRFGVSPEDAVPFVRKLSGLRGLRFRGISSHPGQVYGLSSPEGVEAVTKTETETLRTVRRDLAEAGFDCTYVTTGSTPTYFGAVRAEGVNVYHPGNYVFHDGLQIMLGAAEEDDCALTVLATVVSHPREDCYLIDAGAKCLGLDQGAHGNSALTGFGRVAGHPELIIRGLSEEVGKITAVGVTDLKVGEQIRIIPNHSCSTANLTSHYICTRKDRVERIVAVDLRDNSTAKNASGEVETAAVTKESFTQGGK